jgi:hypothetical protein
MAVPRRPVRRIAFVGRGLPRSPCLRGLIKCHECPYLTDLMELWSFWGSTGRSVRQEFPNISWNSKVHYRVNKSLSLVYILSSINIAHTTPSYFSKIHFNIILPTTSRFSCWFLSLMAFSLKLCVYSCSPPLCYIPCPSHRLLIDHCNYIWRRVQATKLRMI